jgi:hypothetical protein
MSCSVCGKNPAPFRAKSKLTAEQRAEIKAYYASFRDGEYHTGHLRPELLELPVHLCAEHQEPADV